VNPPESRAKKLVRNATNKEPGRESPASLMG
jgi:hypothetical protein